MEAVVSVVVEQLGSILIREVEEKVRLVVGVEKEVESLTSKMMVIKAVVGDAERKQFKEETVMQWIKKLKNVCYDIDDVLDEWNTAILKSKSEIESAHQPPAPASNPMRKVRSLICSACSCISCREVGLRQDVAGKIQDLKERLKEIATEMEEYKFAISKEVEEPERIMTTSIVNVAEVKGRVDDQNKIKGKLLSENCEPSSNPHIISLVGMGGIGKTTLARLVYNANEVVIHFQNRIWVCVSDSFDEIRVAKAILESLIGETPNLVELQAILQQLQENLKGKKFLLVLDDVWEEDTRKWEQLKHSLICGSPGSKILVTTRKRRVAEIMGSTDSDIFPLGELSKEDCWSIFKELAFFGRSSEECERLEGVGREIVDKCKGLPLAVKSLGGVLRFKKSKQEWQRVLDSEVWEEEKVHKDVIAPLLLSYYDLPPPLRRCFSICAIFPKDEEIWCEGLIRLWMAQGYLKKIRGKSMYSIGEEYFQQLVVRSFFQEFDTDIDDKIILCKMHDMVHDLAQFLTQGECFSIDLDNIPEELRTEPVCEEARHAMVVFEASASLPKSYSMQKLRSLLLRSYQTETEVGLCDLFNNLTCLRSLSLGYGIATIPSNINKLVHLRQLDVSNNENLKKLPETICELYNLQILDVGGCGEIVLPRGVGKLINLTRLYNANCIEKPLPKGIGRLSWLERLEEFIIGSDSDSCSLADLKNLNCLQGYLGIKGLENAGNGNEVEEAQFVKMTQLYSLSLDFGEKEEEIEWKKSHDEKLLEAFEPPSNLEVLSLRCCQATRMPVDWLKSFSKLRKIYLFNCRHFEVLPHFGNLPSLERLNICGMDGVEKVGAEFLGMQNDEHAISFPKLTSLAFQYMKNWEEWVDDGDSIQTSIMPCLGDLLLLNCYKLKALPSYLLQKTPLKDLKIRRCPILEERYAVDRGEDWSKVSHIPNVSISSKNVSMVI